LTQAILPVMLRQGAGHIVNVSSMAGGIAPPGMAAYAATRHGLIVFSDALRRELDGTGIYVSTVLPTWTRTPMIRDVAERAMRRSGAMRYGEIFDEAEVPAAAIVDAVRTRRREIQLGGRQMRGGYIGERLAGPLIDLYIRTMVDVPGFIEAVRGLGE
jgi:short-subunit dehydrogenase